MAGLVAVKDRSSNKHYWKVCLACHFFSKFNRLANFYIQIYVCYGAEKRLHRVVVILNTSDYANFYKAWTTSCFGKRNYEYVQCAVSYVLLHHVMLSHDSPWAKKRIAHFT